MTLTNNNTNASRDEEVARALQEQYRREVPPSAWSQFQTMFSSDGGGMGAAPTAAAVAANTNSNRSRPSASAPPARSNSDSTSYRTPKYKKMNSGSSPDTAVTSGSTPSPDRRAGGFSLSNSQQQQRSSQNNKPRNSLKSTPRSSPRSSPRGSPRSSPRSSPRPSPRGSPSTSPRGSPRNSFSFTSLFVDTANDEAVARKLEQELRDAELSSSLARASADFAVESIPVGNIATLPSRRGDGFVESPSTREQRGSQRGLNRGLDSSSPPNDCRGKFIHYSLRIVLAILVAGITFIIFITVFGSQTTDSLDPASWLPGYPEMDPSLGSVGEHNKWRPLSEQDPSGGLTLTVLNNLASDNDWNDYLRTSIYEWDNGTPDAVTLNIRSMIHDPDCRAVRRAMKVCNANYGPTDWRGVNQILLQDDYIITSLAKMNDYYLEGTNRAQKQYTMCHELGHGLGLGHSDENFHNADLGNCMDYTERPQNNMHPDTSNFETLEELYGNANGNVRMERLEVQGGVRRMTEAEERLLEEEFDKYAAYLLDPIEASSNMQSGDSQFIDSEGKEVGGSWRLLLKTDTVEYHERRLGNGYSIRTSFLLA